MNNKVTKKILVNGKEATLVYPLDLIGKVAEECCIIGFTGAEVTYEDGDTFRMYVNGIECRDTTSGELKSYLFYEIESEGSLLSDCIYDRIENEKSLIDLFMTCMN